jgi:hypothetical protein
MSVTAAFLIIALILFLLATFGFPSKINLVACGLAFGVLSVLWPMLPFK